MAALAIAAKPVTLTAMVFFSFSQSSSGFMKPVPALITTRSTPPICWMSSENRRIASPVSETSICLTNVSPPISCCNSASSGSRRAASPIVYPSLASVRASALPIPDEAPTMIAFFMVSPFSLVVVWCNRKFARFFHIQIVFHPGYQSHRYRMELFF